MRVGTPTAGSCSEGKKIIWPDYWKAKQPAAKKSSEARMNVFSILSSGSRRVVLLQQRLG